MRISASASVMCVRPAGVPSFVVVRFLPGSVAPNAPHLDECDLALRHQRDPLDLLPRQQVHEPRVRHLLAPDWRQHVAVVYPIPDRFELLAQVREPARETLQ